MFDCKYLKEKIIRDVGQDEITERFFGLIFVAPLQPNNTQRYRSSFEWGKMIERFPIEKQRDWRNQAFIQMKIIL